jgi:hypothetical protein
MAFVVYALVSAFTAMLRIVNYHKGGKTRTAPTKRVI